MLAERRSWLSGATLRKSLALRRGRDT